MKDFFGMSMSRTWGTNCLDLLGMHADDRFNFEFCFAVLETTSFNVSNMAKRILSPLSYCHSMFRIYVCMPQHGPYKHHSDQTLHSSKWVLLTCHNVCAFPHKLLQRKPALHVQSSLLFLHSLPLSHWQTYLHLHLFTLQLAG